MDIREERTFLEEDVHDCTATDKNVRSTKYIRSL